MSHTDIESTPHGLQEIRSWASRSPGSARPGFRIRQPGGLRRVPRFTGSALLAAIVLLLSLAGFRFLQVGQDTPGPVAVPEPEQVASSAPVPAEEAPPATEIVEETPRITQEPVPAPAALPAQPAPEERSRKEVVAVRRKPAAKEPKASPAIVVSRDAFESEPAVLLAEPAAEYPEAARGTGTSAKIIVGFTIDETGVVRNPVIERIQIQGDAPKAPFEQEALAAARRARFTPAQERGVPTRSWSTLTFSFETGAPNAGI